MQSVRKGIYLVFLPLVTVHIRALTPRALASVLPLSFCRLALLNISRRDRALEGVFTFFNFHLGMFLKGWYSCRVSLFLILTVLFMTAIINLIIFVNDDCEHSDQYRISPRWSHELILCTILRFLESMIRQPAGFRRKKGLSSW